MQFSHTYQSLPEAFFARVEPARVPAPELVIFNEDLARELGLNLSQQQPLAEWFSGKTLPDGASPIAQAYAGHQFGHLNQLGDGRAVLLGEIVTPEQSRWDIQLKGSGRTPFSRGGDGKATLAPMLREYLMSEAMHTLHIPTSRSLAVVTTGETVARMTPQLGAILTRVAGSHLRVGTFVYASLLSQQQNDLTPLRELLDYAIVRHYPELEEAENRALALLDKVIEQQAYLVTQWSRVGFIHGVMNTDNVTISGETIDYGPCAFMDNYGEKTVFSSIDEHGRYAFGNQPPIMHWNMARFAESLLALIDDDSDKAIAIATDSLDNFATIYEKTWGEIACAKIGLPPTEANQTLADELFALLQTTSRDYTNTFKLLTETAMAITQGQSRGLPDGFADWGNCWQSRLDDKSVALMQSHNPVVIPRNHLVERALGDAENGDLSTFKALLGVLQKPYDWQNRDLTTAYQQPPSAEWARGYRTFCGT